MAFFPPKKKTLRVLITTLFISLLPMTVNAATDGDWTGTTDQDLSLSFSVSGNTVENITTSLRIYCSGFSALVLENHGTASIVNNSFTVNSSTFSCTPYQPSNTKPYTFTGTFTNDNTCEGTYAYNYSQTGTWETSTQACATPEISDFDASPSTITDGETSVLSWSLSNIDSAEIDQGVGIVNELDGDANVTPSTTTIYTITATNGCGSTTAEANVTVTPLPPNDTSITGTIYQADGYTPITGESTVFIDLYDHDFPHNSIKRVPINTSNGTFVFSELSAGNYDLRVSAQNYIDEFWASGGSVYFRYQRETVTLSDGQQRSGIDFQLDTGTTLSGTVYEADGTTPINGPTFGWLNVDAYVDQGCNMWDYTTAVRADGTYTMQLPPGTFYASAGGESHIAEWWTGQESVRDCSAGEPFIINEAPPVTGIDFQLDGSATVSGTIFHSDGVTPITDDQQISVFFDKDNPCIPGAADGGGPVFEDGTFSYSLEPGTYYVSVSATNYIDKWWASPTGVDSCSQAQAIVVGSDGVNNLHFQLEPGILIGGTVYKMDGVTLDTNNPNLGISAIPTNIDPCSYDYSVAGYSGNVDTSFATYSIKVPDGEYYLLLNTGDHGTNEWWAQPTSLGTDQCDMAQKLSVSADGDYTNINFRSASTFDAPAMKITPILLLLLE